MIPHHPLRVLDASALVELMHGHPTMMRLVDLAHDGGVTLVVPALAVLEAQAAIRVPAGMWDHILGLRGLRDLDLSARTAVHIGDLAGPRLAAGPARAPLQGEQMVAQVVHETTGLGAAVVVTAAPSLYAGHPVVLMELRTPQ